ncbi:CRISPR-associated protein Cas5 [Candidatus Desulforudis audaxviator]|uniref:CRISPR-associated protein Cas5 family n=1 Tax=Desulforudis audaxviator (strain MP104C) TaxID=477974 RepID=B1I4M5_DESAP|nr:CRISPR-associated protein Cas5 [Candidatus Desulforudis audaxviator]ACA59802.1 CRISPR-associated protein Cas5 family [Candidatus Desulforudis audaxviator MP104C]AZK59805.1 CRISPR-associated protein, Cas5t family [Candidatus Desulforudis audaxviator]
MRVAKVHIEAPIASFRYPHFLIGRQTSFDMPPPSTIYGHIASAVGEWFNPATVKFAYQFSFQAKGSDLEHQHVITKGGQTFKWGERKYPVSTQAVVQPHLRDFLFGCRLTLYLYPPDLAEAFRNPVFCVILGRSQDLASITSVEVIELEKAKGAYLEQTLLPFAMRPLLGRGVTVLMPRYIEPPPGREPHFGRYIMLFDLVYAGEVPHTNRLLQHKDRAPEGWLVDPYSPAKHEGARRGLVFHSFVGDEDSVARF